MTKQHSMTQPFRFGICIDQEMDGPTTLERSQ